MSLVHRRGRLSDAARHARLTSVAWGELLDMHTRTTATVAIVSLSLFAMACSKARQERVAATRIANTGAADFFVSPKGKDTWSGKLAEPGKNDGPFATVARAREAVRAMLKTQKEPRRVRVVLRGGTYYRFIRKERARGLKNVDMLTPLGVVSIPFTPGGQHVHQPVVPCLRHPWL